jgi:hypothetical protein
MRFGFVIRKKDNCGSAKEFGLLPFIRIIPVWNYAHVHMGVHLFFFHIWWFYKVNYPLYLKNQSTLNPYWKIELTHSFYPIYPNEKRWHVLMSCWVLRKRHPELAAFCAEKD